MVSRSPWVRWTTCFGALAAIAAFGGCANTYRFKVEAIENVPSPAGQSFQVINANPEMVDTDLRFLEAVEYVKAALSSKGFYEVPSGAEPDMVIEVVFGIDGPYQETHSVMVPVLVSPEDSRGFSKALVNPGVELGDTLEQPMTIVVTVYHKFLRISAHEASMTAGDRPQREIWSVMVSNRDKSNDLRKYVRLLVAAAMDHVAENLEGAAEVTLTAADARIAFVSRGF